MIRGDGEDAIETFDGTALILTADRFFSRLKQAIDERRFEGFLERPRRGEVGAEMLFGRR